MKIEPIGKRIHIDSYYLHVIDSGEKKDMPVVVFEHGVATPALIWGLVYPEISKMTRTIVYDRAGYGWSDSGSMPRTNQKCVEELYILLQKLQIQEPVILVGHSFGGINIRLFAEFHPTLVAGLIFVDPAHEDEFSNRFPPEHQKQRQLETKSMLLVQRLIKLGVIPLLAKLKLIPEFSVIANKFPNKFERLLWEITFRYSAFEAAYSEILSLTENNIVKYTNISHEVPIVVLKATNFNQFVPGTSEEIKEEIKIKLQEVATELSQLTKYGELNIIENSGHLIHVDQPQIVIETIKNLLFKAVNKSSIF